MIDAGADGFVRKPFRSSEIFNTLAHFLQVNYQYENEVYNSPLHTLKVDSFQGVDANILIDLRTSILILDNELAQEAVEKISEINPTLAQTLSSMIHSLAYRPILDALNTHFSQTELN